MIRDEFKNLDKKEIQKKSNKKLMQMGERAYYSTRVQKYGEIFKPVKASTIFTLVSFGIMAILFLLPVILGSPDYTIPTLGMVVIVVEVLIIIWAVVWFAFLAPHLRRKLKFWKQELAQMNKNYVMRHRSK